MNNKAFTIMEILTIVIVLGLILVIATPKIMGIIDETKKAAFKISAKK